MNDANQVRINELARELEVKAKAIIDLLPGYGVTEKKTHSSSIPVDVAEKVRKKLAGGGDDEPADAAVKPAETKSAAPSVQPAATPAVPPRPPTPAAAPVAPRPAPAATPSAAPTGTPAATVPASRP